MKNFLLFFLAFFMTSLISCTEAEIGENEDDAVTTIFLVRHAEKVKDGSEDPALTEEGKLRARRLQSMFQHITFNAVFSTDFERTRETAKPTALANNLDVKIYNHKAFDELTPLLEEHKGGNILITGHSNSTPTLVNLLIGKEEFTKLDEDQYDRLYVVSLSKSMSKAVVLSY